MSKNFRLIWNEPDQEWDLVHDVRGYITSFTPSEMPYLGEFIVNYVLSTKNGKYRRSGMGS